MLCVSRDRIRSVIRDSLITFNTQLCINNIVFKPTPTNKHKIYTLTLLHMRAKNNWNTNVSHVCCRWVYRCRCSFWSFPFLAVLDYENMLGFWIKCDLYVLHIWFLVHTLVCCGTPIHTRGYTVKVDSQSIIFFSPVVLLAKLHLNVRWLGKYFISGMDPRLKYSNRYNH